MKIYRIWLIDSDNKYSYFSGGDSKGMYLSVKSATMACAKLASKQRHTRNLEGKIESVPTYKHISIEEFELIEKGTILDYRRSDGN